VPERHAVHDRVEERVRRHPERLAVVDGGTRVSYRELWRESGRIAAVLAGAGVPAGGLVGLRMARGWRTIAAILAVWRHGCGYVPVDEAAPPARQRHILRHAGLTHVLADGTHVETTGTGTTHPVPDGTAYVVFTSGSTGAAKGVVVTQHNITALLDAAAFLAGDRAGVWSQAHTHNFDFSVWEMWVPLTSGGRCVLVPGEVVADGPAFVELLRRQRVTVLDIVPSAFRGLLAAATATGTRLPRLRRVIFGGEAVVPDDVRRWWRSGTADGAVLHNMYGITETTVHVTDHRLTAGSLAAAAPGTPIGEPLPHLRVELLDQHRHPVRPGDPGEMYVSGTGVAHGYLGRADLTADRFVSLDLGDGPRTWYRTGDLARRTPHGLAYLGRTDDQVKIRGIRVEPAETERALLTHPAVDRAAVLPTRDHVRALLPPAFVPTTIHALSTWPTTESGKLDRSALQSLLASRPTSPEQPDGPDALARLWSAATAHGADENTGFLSLGGHSLSALRFTGEVESRYGIRLPVAALLRDNAPLTAIRHLLAHPPHQTPPGRADRPRGTESVDSWPLDPGQRRIWLQDRLNPHAAAYNVLAVLHCPGARDPHRAARALRAAVARHPALLARLREPRSGLPRWFRDLTTTVPVDQLVVADPDAVPSCAAEFGARPFDLNHDLPVRLALIEAPGTPGLHIALCLHHIVSDQRSVEVLLTDFAHLHDTGTHAGATRVARSRPHPEPPADPATADADRRYWTDLLRDTPGATPLPFRTGGNGSGGAGGQLVRVELDARRSAELDAVVAGLPTTAFVAFAAVLGALLAEWCGQDTLVFAVPASRRRTAAQDHEVGFLLDTLPIRVDVPPGATFRELLAQVRDRFLAAVEHSSVPFDDLVSALGRGGGPGRHPVFNVWLNDLTRNAEPPAVGGEPSRLLDQATPPALFDLNLYLHRRAGTYRVEVVAAAGLLPAPVVDALAHQLLHLLTAACAAPDAPVRALPLTPLPSAAERSGARASGSGGTTVHQLARELLAAARSRGAAPAVEKWGAGLLSCAEVAERVARVAGDLRAAGAGAGAVVEVSAARGVALPVGLLACWMAGAVPGLVDARWPAARRRSARELLGPRCVLLPDLTIQRLEGGRDLPGAGHVLFTSGTSGDPAPVLVDATALPAAMAWYRDEFEPSPADRVALLSGPAHDPVLRDVLAPLLAGGTCVVPPEGTTANPVALADFLVSGRITVLHATPPLLRLLLAALRDRPRRLDALRLVVSGGAPLPADLTRELAGYTAAAVVNAYGLTESPQIAAWYPLTGTEPAGTTVPIGRAVPGGHLQVRTPYGHPAAPGQRGELVLRAGRLALGYLDDTPTGQDTTGRERVFGTDPDGTPVLYTGDLARVDPGGRVHLDGRADRQVELHGFRIELASLEAVATRHPLVDHAVARLATTPEGAALELDVVAGGPVTVDDVLRHLRAVLPAHAVPTTVRVSDHLALDGNNKRVAPAGSAGPPAAAAAEGALVEVVGQAVREVLGREIPVRRNFFDAGLTSMSLVALGGVLERRLGRGVAVTELFEHTTVLALAGRLGAAPPVPAGPAGPRGAGGPGGAGGAGGVDGSVRRARRVVRREALLAIGGRDER
jgi:amino acid adenylation domain-containing protein